MELNLKNFRESWIRLEKAKGVEFQNLLREFYLFLSHELKFTLRQIRFHSKFAVGFYDMSELRIEVSEETPIFFLQHTFLNESEIDDIIYNIKGSLYKRNLQENISFLCITGNEKYILEKVRDSYLDLIVLNRQKISNILTSDNRIRTFVDTIGEQSGISIISPYSSTRIPIGAMFYGRKKEIKKIIRSKFETNFAIIGSRRIGKTSLMLNVKKYLDNDDFYETKFYDCYRINNSYDFVQLIASDLDIRSAQRTRVSTFYDFMKRMKAKYRKKFILFIDEFDQLLEYDKTLDGELSKIFHALALEDICKIVIAGYRILNDYINNINSPFYKYFEVAYIKELDHDDARQLILEPFDDLGIRIHDKNSFSERIMHLTANHPHFIQFFCSKLVELLNEKSDKELNMKDIDRVENMNEYNDFILDTFLVNADEFQQLIVYEMLERKSFNEKTILEYLKKDFNLNFSLNSVQRDCRSLILANILTKEKGEYRLSYPALSYILKNNYDLDFSKNRLVQEISSREKFNAR
ncbi:MAG: AAA family ATPase [candidate division KSB1 bacterium]|jgi:hypothetical protein|nr:AAA family ATPase [candidate division KSB1 bacterium]